MRTSFDKIEFNDVLRASLSEQVISEVNRLIAVFGQSTEQTIFEGGSSVEAVLRSNVAQFKTAVEAAIDEWASSAPGAVEKSIMPDTPMELAMVAMTKMIDSGGTEQRRRMTTTNVLKSRADVVATVAALAKKKQEADPSLPLATARARVWAERDERARRYDALPPLAHTPDPEPVVQGGQAVVDRATAKAQELMQADPEKYPNVAAARAEVWKRHPELGDQYDLQLLAKAAPVGGDEQSFQEAQQRIAELLKPGISREQALLQLREQKPDLVRRAYGIS